MKQKKDRIFVITLGLILANLVYYFAGTLTYLQTNWTSAWYWAVLFVNGVAIIGVLWLLRTYRRGRKLGKAEEAQEREDSEEG